ncbi:hypothetical protein ACFHWS_05580 [Micromonospora sp. LOL_013]|uniref:hypothetical protein n=2 Tax=unclassified Micromonospora TaxID=2617518 RepID=UPI003A89E417
MIGLLVGVRSVGVLRTGLAVLGGQLVCALLIDVLVPGGPSTVPACWSARHRSCSPSSCPLAAQLLVRVTPVPEVDSVLVREGMEDSDSDRLEVPHGTTRHDDVARHDLQRRLD